MKKCMHVLIGLTAALLFAAAMSSCKGAVSQTDAAASADTSAQDKAAVAKAKAKLEIGYRSGDSKESVTQRLTLPQTVDGCPGITVTWESSEPKAVASDGTVTRSHADKEVTLTATLKKNAATDKKAFTVTVLKTNAAVQEVEKAKEKLEISYVSGDSKDTVTQNLTLPAAVSGFTDVSITWKSDKPETVKDDGTVTRPDMDTTVTLTATLEKNGEKTKKTFTVTVKGTAAEWIEEKLKHAGVQPLVISGTAAEVTLSGSEEVTWTSNQPAVIDVQGKHEGTCAVTKPTGTASVSVILTATVTKAGLKKEKSFTVVVYPENSILDIDKLLTAIALPAETETDIPLPKTIDGIAETSITWQSDKADVLSIIDTSDGKVTGKITRKEQDETVGLTATLSYKGAERQKTFTVTVRRDYDKAAVKNAFEKLGIGYTSGNSESSVTENLELPETIAGVSITWKSNKPETVKDDGTVIRPVEADIQVTLTATLTKGQVTKQKVFTVTVLHDQDKLDVKTAYNKLEIGYKTGDSKDAVRHKLTLSKTVAEAAGVSITWKSNKPETVKDDGTVIRPAEADIQVTLTATLTKGQVTKQKVFTVTVLHDQDKLDVKTAYNKLEIGYKTGDSKDAVRHKLTLSKTVAEAAGVSITWKSNKPETVKDDGTVIRPAEADIQVTLTATLTKGQVTKQKTFTVTVLRDQDIADLESALKKLKIGYNQDDRERCVKGDLMLPDKVDGFTGVAVTWESNNTDIIKNDGKVTRPDLDTKVTLTATLKKNKAEIKKPFTVKVVGIAGEQVDQAFRAATVTPLAIQKSLYQITLSGSREPTLSALLTWTSSHPAVIGVKGKPSGTYPVTPPAEKTIVTLTAKAEKAGIAKEKNFTVTVFPENSNPSLDEWFDAAIPKEVTTDIDLPANYDGTSATAITWTSSNGAALNVQGSKGLITPDLVDQPVILTAKLTYNSQAIEKPISITVKRLTRLENSFKNGDGNIIDFPDNEIVMTKEIQDGNTGETKKIGARFSYSDLDIPHKRFKVKGTHLLSNNGTWVAIGSAEHRQVLEAQLEERIPYRKFEKLFNRPRITLRDFGAAFDKPLSTGEQELFDILLNWHPLSVSSYTAFKKLSETEQTGVLKKWIDGVRKEQALAESLPETASWEDILRKGVDDRLNKEKQKASPKIYEYKIEGSNGSYEFEAYTVYENGKKWFEHGHYYNKDNGKAIWFDNYGLTFSYDKMLYVGKLNSDGTQFTGTGRKADDSSESITVTITDNQNGTISIQVNGHTHTLNFQGNRLEAGYGLEIG